MGGARWLASSFFSLFPFCTMGWRGVEWRISIPLFDRHCVWVFFFLIVLMLVWWRGGEGDRSQGCRLMDGVSVHGLVV